MGIKPILFNTEMVRAILDGRKSCTRRLLKGPFTVHPNGYITKPRGNENFCPYEPPYQPGDILYVRETWQCWRAHRYEATADIRFRAGGDDVRLQFANGNTDSINRLDYDAFVHKWFSHNGEWKPSLFMPKEAARIWLKVTDVRVDRLQEITEKQACMEGTEPWDEVCYENNGWHPTFSDPDSGGDPNMIDGFHKLWNSTIKKSDIDRYGWDANPYVWVISFERCEKPKGV